MPGFISPNIHRSVGGVRVTNYVSGEAARISEVRELVVDLRARRQLEFLSAREAIVVCAALRTT